MVQCATQVLVLDEAVEIEGHPTRQAILACLATNPGANIQSVCDEIGANRGTATYHLRALERQGTLQSVRTGRERRFFLCVRGAEQQVVGTIGRGPGGRIAAAAVAAGSGMNQEALVGRLKISRKSFRRHMGDLVARSLVVSFSTAVRNATFSHRGWIFSLKDSRTGGKSEESFEQ